MEATNEKLFGTEAEKTIGIIKKARELINEYVLSRPSIDKLLKDKVADYILIREIPLPIAIGEKKIYVGTFTMETMDVFFTEYAKVMGLIAARHAGLEVGIKMIQGGTELYQIILKDRLIKKWIYRLIDKTILKKQNYIDPITNKFYKLPKVSIGYFKKHATTDDVMQILLMTYIYNFDATKRSLNLLMGEMGASQVSEVCVSSWLANLAGMSGKYLSDPSDSLEPYILELQKQERERAKEIKKPG